MSDLDSDFFTRQRPRLQPMTHEEYKNARKRRDIEQDKQD